MLRRKLTPWEAAEQERLEEEKRKEYKRWTKEAESVGFTQEQLKFLEKYFSQEGHRHPDFRRVRF